jgi:acyl-CoA thioesterase FadM
MLMRLRTARTVARATFAPKEVTSRVALTVRWADCDLNLHMTNSRYLAVMDVGRWDLTVRSGVLAQAVRRGLRPTVVEAHLAFRRELRPGTRYVLDTRVVERRGKAWVFEQLFVVGDRVHAKGEIVVLTVSRGGKVVDARELFEPLLVERVRVEGFVVTSSRTS